MDWKWYDVKILLQTVQQHHPLVTEGLKLL